MGVAATMANMEPMFGIKFKKKVRVANSNATSTLNMKRMMNVINPVKNDVKNFVESSYTFSINDSNPKSIVSYLDQKYVKPIFIPSNPWPFRFFTFGSIVGIFYLAQIWIDVDFGGDGTNNSSQASGSH